MWIENNDLSGPIPPELGHLSLLARLDLHGNRLTGSIPVELGNLANLEVLRLEQNRLTGPFPQSVLGIAGLEDLRFQENAGLCVPGTTDFVAWAVALDNRTGSFCNEADRAALETLYGSTGGDGWTNAEGWLTDAAIGEWHGATADSLGRIVEVDLEANGLDGSVPGELGDLTRMTVLKLGGNALSGRLPESLARVPLREFRYDGTGLCAPGAAAFQEWLAGIASHEGTGVECEPVSDRDVLTALYKATGGPNWTNSQNWLTDAPLEEWHGVGVDGEGRVTDLDLNDNGLTGRIPPEVGSLPLTQLNLRDNALYGPLPPEIGGLVNLTYLSVDENGLTGPIPPELGHLSNLRQLYVAGNRLTGPLPPELGRLSNLEILDFRRNPLTGPIPVELGSLSNLRELRLGRTRYWAESQCDKRRDPDRPPCYPTLTGTIPRELGNLANLEFLDLGWNDLSGSIPTELGNLSRLRTLRLESNRLSGPIPPEVGNLSGLKQLLLRENELTGSIPSAIGDLSGLEHLALSHNKLTDTLPAVLGHLAELRLLDAEFNGLSGRIPRQLGSLTHLEELILGFNDLGGSVPAQFGGLVSLRKLILTANTAMSGALPDTLAALGELEFLAAGGTGLCAPQGAAFDAWLAGLSSAHVAMCGGGAPAAYLVQAVQSRVNPVPLAAGDEALVRIFPTAATETDAGIPPVRVRFYLEGGETHVEEIPAKAGPLPIDVYEGSLKRSANAVIAGSVIQPGLEMVVEIDPDSTLDPSLGVARRIPETGRMALDVAAVPHFDLTLVPFLRIADPDSLILDLTARMAADPHNDPALWGMKTLLPVNDSFEVALHDVVWTSDHSNYGPLREAQALQVLEGTTGHHMAMLSENGVSTGIWETRTSLIYVDGRDGRYRMGNDDAEKGLGGLIAHEMGHAMTLGHAPGCFPGSRDTFMDPSYPYSTGITGAWGYDFRDGGAVVRPGHVELMAFCGGWRHGWISDYHFAKAMRHRLRDEVEGAATVAAPVPSILLWGGVDEAGVPFLEPTFVVDATPTLPDSTGEYRITGRTSSGGVLFSLSFRMPEYPDDDAEAGFVFALPARPEWADLLARITLSGPGGSATLDETTKEPMAILRDPRTGQVRGFLSDLSPGAQTAADAVGQIAGQGMEVLFSRGIPGTEAWKT